MSEELKLEGKCFCGNCKFAVKGKPLFNGYCHCTLCQRHNGAPYVHEIGFPLPSLEVLSGSDDMQTFESTPGIFRRSCTKCRGLLYITGNAEGLGDFVGVPAGLLSRDENGKLKHIETSPPEYHIFYANRVYNVKDDLPKFVAFPGGETIDD